MHDCICSSCRNLKGVIGENGECKEYECEFGFPSEGCDDCKEEACEETCNNYISDEEIGEVKIVKCKECGRELEQATDDNDAGEVFCINCYLKNED